MPKHAVATIRAREIIDCRGNPTVEVDVFTEDGASGTAQVPSGLSTGRHEAKELRDGGERYDGKGVQDAVRHVLEEIAPSLHDVPVTAQREIDRLLCDLDGTPDKSRLGANALLGVSLACARAAADALGLPLYAHLNPQAAVLPTPEMNLINGGRHASDGLDFQEFIVIPVDAASFGEAVRMTVEIKSRLGRIVESRYGRAALNTGDEGGFTPPCDDPFEAFDLLHQAAADAGYADRVAYGLDAAASHLYDASDGSYTLAGAHRTRDEMIDLYRELRDRCGVVTIEDPLDQDDYEGFRQVTEALGIQIVGDDLFVTQVPRLRRGIEQGAANALLWKVNQVGTLSEAWDAAELAFRNGYGVVVSERSGDTEDPLIADLSVALGSGLIKTGAPTRGERTAKYNRLLRIEQELGAAGRYAGRSFQRPF